MAASDDSDDPDNDSRDSSEYDHWGCEKCGMKMSTLKELIGHKDTHRIFQCARCHLRFTSNYLADKHELSCQGSTDSDVFEASRTIDPLLVVMNSLGQLVDTFDKARAINKDVTGMMKDQLRKAKHNHAASRTAEENHQVQRTWTFLKPPTFTPNNIINKYAQPDKQTHNQANKHANKQTNNETNTQTHKHKQTTHTQPH